MLYFSGSERHEQHDGWRIIYTPSGEIIATGVSEEEYLDKYAEHFCEWVDGTVINMAPATLRHDETLAMVRDLLEAYFELSPIGLDPRRSPFLMRLPTWRQPRT